MNVLRGQYRRSWHAPISFAGKACHLAKILHAVRAREAASRVPKQSLVANTMDVPVYLLKLRLAGIYDPGERMD